MTTLVARDYRGALEFLRIAHESEEPVPFSTNVLGALRRVIPCAIASYREWDERAATYEHWASGVEVRAVERIWDRYPAVRWQDPLPGVCPRGVVRVPPSTSFRLSDFIPMRRFRRLELYQDICRPVGTNFIMKLFLPGDRISAGFVLESGRRDFSERDRDVLDLLAPHLILLRRRQRAAVGTAGDSEALAALTARERDVLRLVANGLTNPEISVALLIAPGTVRKHLDNVYRKLGVRGRAEAVAVAQLSR